MKSQTRRGYAVEFKTDCMVPMWDLLREVADWLEFQRPDLENGALDCINIGFYGDEEGKFIS